MCNVCIYGFCAFAFQRTGGLTQCTGGIDHVVHHDAVLAFDFTDDVHDFGLIRPGATLVDDDEIGVVEALREWRLAEAKKRRIPAFRIFSNRVLLALAEARPSSEEELLAVKGVGDMLLRKYGERLLSILARS